MDEVKHPHRSRYPFLARKASEVACSSSDPRVARVVYFGNSAYYMNSDSEVVRLVQAARNKPRRSYSVSLNEDSSVALLLERSES